MNKDTQTYYQQRLPDLIYSLKSKVTKNMDIVDRDVEHDLGSDKYLNVLKGRRMAVESSISTMKQIDKLAQENKLEDEGGYFKSQLPDFIERLKSMFDNNLKVVDLDIDDEDDENLKDQIGDQIEEIFGPEMSKKIFKKLGPGDKLSEDKYINVLKARDAASTDNEWLLNTIDSLENILHNKEVKTEKKKSWALEAAE
ncbi:hypothetical protein [Thalassobellus suaedae]|uniref:Uncharacterized protein n=1 Tax=Thalassobellus suaedae TaxID=3074124 RepID=A0ABY9XVR1_9FLAO|nr:hypothetical protein RHP51_04945 [Flavobacteriaceae bacterium HL-DH14]